MATKTSPRAVRKALAERYGAGQIEMYRSPAGYYYFTGHHPEAVYLPSLYWFNLDGNTTEEVLEHVADALAAR